MVFLRYGELHYKEKTVIRPSYLYNRNSYSTGKTTSLYWDGPMVSPSCSSRDNSVNALSQCETMLQCNVVSHWLGAFTKWSLSSTTYRTYLSWNHRAVCRKYHQITMSIPYTETQELSRPLLTEERRRSYGYRNPHYKPKMVWPPSLVHNGNPYTGLILGLHPANERRRYKVTPSLIGLAQT